MFWGNVGAGVIANIVFVVLTVGIGIIVLVIRRRAFLRFWGIREIKKVRVYISHLRIAQGGALDANGTARSYQGNVVTQLESEMALLIKNLSGVCT